LNPHAAPPPDDACLGLCNGRDARALFYATVHDVIVPDLQRLGIPASYAWHSRRPLSTAA
jgi:hypothetical protein